MSVAENDWVVDIHADIAPLEGPWRALEALGCCTAFQSFGWASAWYESVSRHGAAEPVIVAARRASAPEIEVILPLCRIRRRGYWEIAFADLGVTDFIGPVFMPRALSGADAIRGLTAAVAKALPRCDVIRLDKICVTVGRRGNPLGDLPDLVAYTVGLWGVALTRTGTGQPPHTANRRVFRKTEKKAAELSAHAVRTFEWIEEPEELRRVFSELVDLRIARFAALGRTEILQEQMWLDFYRRLVSSPNGKLRVAIATIKADGKIIAAAFGVGYDQAFHYLLPAFAMEEWGHYMPGLQLVFELMRECPGRGFDYLDLTIGDERYKKDVGAERRPLFETRIPATLKGRLICRAWRLKMALKAYPRLFALIRRLAGRRPEPSQATLAGGSG